MNDPTNNAIFVKFSSPGKGIGLRATKTVNPGETVLSESALCHILSNNQRGMRCDFCLNERTELMKCSRCKFMYYCGVKCQKSDWNMHKKECKCLRKVHPKRPPDFCLLAARFIQRLTELKPQFADEKMKQIEKCQNMIIGKETLIDDKRKEMLFTFAFVLQQLLNDELKNLLSLKSNQLMGLLCWLSCNCFTILDDEMASIGIAVYEKTCFLNHSCRPNCIAVFEGSEITIRAIREVEENEEFFISYIESLEETEVRKGELLERYFFHCQCDLCIADAPRGKDYIFANCRNSGCSLFVKLSANGSLCSCGCTDFPKSYFTTARKHHHNLSCELEKFKKDISLLNFDHLAEAFERALVYIAKKSIIIIHCFEALFDACIKFEKWKLATEYGASLLQLYGEYYQEFHPMIGIQLFKLGKIHLYLENLDEGINCLQRAKRMLPVSHGENHRLVKNLEEMLALAEGELVQLNNYKQLNKLALED